MNYFSYVYKECEEFDLESYISDQNMLNYVKLKCNREIEYLMKTDLNGIKIHEINHKYTKDDGTICLTIPYEISHGQDSAFGRSAYFEVQEQQDGRITSYNVCYTKLLRTFAGQFLLQL